MKSAQPTNLISKIVNIKELLFDEMSNAFKDMNLNATEIMIIYSLEHKRGSCKAGDLAADLSLPLSTLTGIVDKMIEKDFLIRERPSEDRRVVNIGISPVFQKSEKKCMHLLSAMMADITKEMPAEQINKLLSDLELLENILEKRAQK